MNLDRFLLHVEKTPYCWYWRGNLNDYGYGRVRVHGRLRVAHRVAYELWVGPIPHGALVGHRKECEPCCVHPGHLELIENVVRLTPEQVATIARSFLPLRRLGTIYHVSHQRVYQIKHASSIAYRPVV